ncbi:interferon alpha-inducible protein 27-like protein 2A [Acanthopagrus latus]|uniref:interferon alpha-inducible protein 27-like protein 2A n=1 Tax=Acanthopagrus latus TaxID=8177 RepID=UPI00187CA22E|nr:interferon alpha-inducible protein 27-like protein 2A [Acanthopagrus latus]
MALWLVAAIGAVAGGLGASVVAPAALAGLGFTKVGIAAGSWAASWMGYAAVANGGGVAAGSLFAILQSVGAAGVSAATTAAASAIGGALAMALSAVGC